MTFLYSTKVSNSFPALPAVINYKKVSHLYCTSRFHSSHATTDFSLKSSLTVFIPSHELRVVSGKTITCLGNTSEVAVNTGPYFNGKISVEDTSRRECSIFGNRSSSLDLYTMTINHTLCGSKIVVSSQSYFSSGDESQTLFMIVITVRYL